MVSKAHPPHSVYAVVVTVFCKKVQSSSKDGESKTFRVHVGEGAAGVGDDADAVV